MKSRTRTLKNLAGTLTVAIMMLGLAHAGSAYGATMPELMKFMPADAHIALGLPDIAGVEQAGSPLFKLPQLSRINEAAVMLGGDTIAEGLANSGIAASAPGAVFLQIGAAGDISVGGVLVVADDEKVRDTMKSLLGGDGAEVDLPGGISGRFVSADKVGYFFNDGNFFVASNQTLLEQLAARNANPAEINYGKSGAKDEVVVWTRLDTIEENNLLGKIEPLSALAPALKTLQPFSDEVIFAIGEQAGKAYLRVAARDSSGAASSPGALALHGFMDTGAPVLLNLRLTPELINAVSTLLSQNPDTRQIGGYVRIASSLLGDELAVSLKGIDPGSKIPDALIAVTVKQPEAVPNLLRMLAKIEEPSYTHNDTSVYVYKNVAEGTDLHIAVEGVTLVVAPGEEPLKKALAAFAESAEGTGVPANIVNQGVYGFLVLDGAKAENIPAGMLPANIDLSQISLALLMGLDNEWRELRLTSPAGFDGIASVLRNLM